MTTRWLMIIAPLLVGGCAPAAETSQLPPARQQQVSRFQAGGTAPAIDKLKKAQDELRRLRSIIVRMPGE